MGQSIVVNEKPSSNPGVIRFETNRALTGMDHERYLAGQEIWGERPPDELARRLLQKPSVAGVQINGNMVTVDLNKGFDSTGLLEVIENLYRFYPDAPEGAEAAAEPVAEDAAPEAQADPEPAAPVDEPAAAEEAPAAEPEAASQAAAEEPSPADPAPTEPVADTEPEPEDATAQPEAAAAGDEPAAPTSDAAEAAADDAAAPDA
ncbi:MAG: hypothetical protein ACTHN0_10860 [Aquihabitans sp.]